MGECAAREFKAYFEVDGRWEEGETMRVVVVRYEGAQCGGSRELITHSVEGSLTLLFLGSSISIGFLRDCPWEKREG